MSARTISSGRVNLPQDAAEPLAALRLRLAERLEIPDRAERVLVYRVLVIEVADHQAIHLLKLGEHPPEQTGVVHLRQPGVEPRARPERAKQTVALVGRWKEPLGRVAVAVPFDAGQHLLRHGAPFVEGGGERAEPGLGLERCEGAVGKPYAVRRPLQVVGEGDWRRLREPSLRFRDHRQRTADDPRVMEVGAHQRFDLRLRLVARRTEQDRRRLLELMAQDVQVAAPFQMQDRPNPE